MCPGGLVLPGVSLAASLAKVSVAHSPKQCGSKCASTTVGGGREGGRRLRRAWQGLVDSRAFGFGRRPGVWGQKAGPQLLESCFWRALAVRGLGREGVSDLHRGVVATLALSVKGHSLRPACSWVWMRPRVRTPSARGVWCGVVWLKRGEVGAGSRGRCQNLGWCGLETEQVFTVQ